jgi:hypothetical protein
MYYDKEKILEIPIEDVCLMYGIRLTRHGQNLWGKIRNEKTSSFSINPERNIWRDWGISKGGDVISLVAELESVDNGTAIRILGEKFNISQEESNKSNRFLPTKNQFAKIGIVSERAISNMDINLEKQSLEKIENLENKYSISMYDLSKDNISLYHSLVDRKALPLIYDDRNYLIDMTKKYTNETNTLDKEMYKNILQSLDNSLNEKIDIYNRSRLDGTNKNNLRLNIETVLHEKGEINMPTEERKFRYYLTQRPPSIGTHPREAIKVESFDTKQEFEGVSCWGYVEYEKALTDKQIEEYELFEKAAEINENIESEKERESKPLIDMKINKDVDVSEIMENLKNGVGNIFNNENFTKYLNFQSNFHNYSPNNNLLIAIQKPEATQVASFAKWNSLGRKVNKGENGIAILAPNVINIGAKQILERLDKDNIIKVGKYTFTKKNNSYNISVNGQAVKMNQSKNELQSFINLNNLKAQMIVGFKKTYVFDISQTNGKEIPQFKINKLKDNDLLMENGYYKMPYIKIAMSESEMFKSGQILTLPEADKLFKEQESKVRGLKEEYESKGEYYPYLKTRFTLYLSPQHTREMRYDIGDGYANSLSHMIQKEVLEKYNVIDKLSKPFGLDEKSIESLNWIKTIKNNMSEIKHQAREYLGTYEELYKNTPYYQDKTQILLSNTGEVYHSTPRNVLPANDQIKEGSSIVVATVSVPYNDSEIEKEINNAISKLQDTIKYNPIQDKSISTIIAIKNQIENCIAAKGIQLEYINDTGSANGYFTPATNKICVKDLMSLSQTTKTLMHEYVHSQLHKDDIQSKDNLNYRQTAEIEAEATTYVVAKHFDFDTSQYSFDYVSSWARGKEISELEETLKNIKTASEKIINEIKSPLELQLYNNKETVIEILKAERVKPTERIISNIIDINKETGKINTISDLTNAEKYKTYGNNKELTFIISNTNKDISNNTLPIEKSTKLNYEMER